jgi:putative FmdB family regulatory protein
MPLYEFTCPGCGRSFEELVRSADAVSSVRCPTCGSANVRRKISLFAAAVGAVAGGFSLGSSAASACAPAGGT